MVSGTVTSNAGTGTRTIVGGATIGSAVPLPLVVGAQDPNGFAQYLSLDNGTPPNLLVAFPASASLAVFGNLNPAFPILVAPAIDATVRNRNSFAAHLTTNTTTHVTAATAYISSIVITTDAAGTTSTITIQDVSATPKKLVNAAVTTAISTTPTVLALAEPVLMTSGIDVITAGVAAATVDIWVTYYQ